EPALVPASPWLGGRVLPAPRVTLGASGVQIEPASGAEPMWWIVRVKRGASWSVDVIPGAQTRYEPREVEGQPMDLIVVSPVDRLGTEGRPAFATPDGG
ncbi:MAG TPA: hypothetical protein VHG08_06150, partial [Longimicrobium sp.]|nr:hypothetical protein [Longimicrobium sp.]